MHVNFVPFNPIPAYVCTVASPRRIVIKECCRRREKSSSLGTRLAETPSGPCIRSPKSRIYKESLPNFFVCSEASKNPGLVVAGRKFSGRNMDTLTQDNKIPIYVKKPFFISENDTGPEYYLKRPHTDKNTRNVSREKIEEENESKDYMHSSQKVFKEYDNKILKKGSIATQTNSSPLKFSSIERLYKRKPSMNYRPRTVESGRNTRGRLLQLMMKQASERRRGTLEGLLRKRPVGGVTFRACKTRCEYFLIIHFGNRMGKMVESKEQFIRQMVQELGSPSTPFDYLNQLYQ